MSEQIKHECGVALIRLRKPLDYYQKKYGSWMYGINKLYLLMEKQHNRGQDGAGIASVKLNVDPGKQYFHRHRSNVASPIKDVFQQVNNHFIPIQEKNPELLNDVKWARENLPFAAELFLGHVRYGTFGKNLIESVHPVMRVNNWRSRNLVLAGNFNLTNVDEIFTHLTSLGQHPVDFSDTVTMLENIGHYLDMENQKLYAEFKRGGYSKVQISDMIARNIDVVSILKESSKKWDGGYVIAGLIGHGDAFVVRDPWGIRPAYYYYDDEVAVVASERPVIQTVFNVPSEHVQELSPGHTIIIKKESEPFIERIRYPEERRACSFERIYFSRGSDKDIYQERKRLGELLIPDILKAVDNDLDNTVFSHIPNTSESAFYGMIKGIENVMADEKKKKILGMKDHLSEEELDKILKQRPRIEKTAIKDVKLRTFISEDKGRDDLVEHVYDVTYGTVKKGLDNLVIIDDSIVRGTTLKRSILKILDRLEPKKIIVVSSAPQIRYPDCYGIDMAKLGDFVAFRAAIALLKERGMEDLIEEVYKKAKEQKDLPKEQIANPVKEIYSSFTAEEISDKIAELLKSRNIKSEVRIVYQSVENLHRACPDHLGDWYFTGNYPTPGGNKVVNTSFINYVEGRDERGY